jgi:hypothetical protein
MILSTFQIEIQINFNFRTIRTLRGVRGVRTVRFKSLLFFAVWKYFSATLLEYDY